MKKMKTIKFINYYDANYINDEKIKKIIFNSVEMLENKSGKGSEFLGWVELPNNYDKEECQELKNVAEEIRKNADVFITVGIGGSYLGARAVIEALSHPFQNVLNRGEKSDMPEMYYAGINMSGEYLDALGDVIKNKSVYINVISKSGTTLEPALAFRFFKEKLEEKYSKEEASKRIICTTDKEKGALKTACNKEDYRTFIVPDDVGGRYSVLTAVGLLPIAVAGIDVDKLMEGASDAIELFNKSFEDNFCYQYVAFRTKMNLLGKKIEIMATYEPSLYYFSEWFKQLFGESEGKEKKGIYPTSVNLTTDLHSLGQYIQEGQRDIFETVVSVEKTGSDNKVIFDKENYDELNFLVDQPIDLINSKAKEGTIKAHVSGGVPTCEIMMPEKNAYYLGQLIYFFEKACAISAYTLGVNPFNQPGVEVYKKNMYELLEELR